MSNVVLWGAPGAGKKELAMEIQTSKPHLRINTVDHQMPKLNLALGKLADYRTEFALAAGRVFLQDNTIYTHSLLDSLTYVSLRTDRIREISEEGEWATWYILTVLLGQMKKDNHQPDYTFYVPGSNGQAFSVDIEDRMVELITGGFEVHILKGTMQQMAEEVVRVMDE